MAEGNRALRVGDWKIVAAGQDSPWELYYLRSDRSETKNLADELPDKVRELATQWTHETAGYNALAKKDAPTADDRKPLPAAMHAAHYSAMVAFGDRLTDMGNRWITSRDPNAEFRATWFRQLAGPPMLNLPEFKPAGMSSYLGGTNYAVGGATTEYTSKIGSDRNRGQSLTQQISKRYLNPDFNLDGKGLVGIGGRVSPPSSAK